jgi:hypothetical protein
MPRANDKLARAFPSHSSRLAQRGTSPQSADDVLSALLLIKRDVAAFNMHLVRASDFTDNPERD